MTEPTPTLTYNTTHSVQCWASFNDGTNSGEPFDLEINVEYTAEPTMRGVVADQITEDIANWITEALDGKDLTQVIAYPPLVGLMAVHFARVFDQFAHERFAAVTVSRYRPGLRTTEAATVRYR